MSTFVLSTVVEDIALEVDPNLVVLLNVNKDFDKTHTSTSGTTIKIRKPDFGAALTSGSDITSVTKTILQGSVDVTLADYCAAVSTTLLEEAFSAGNMVDMVIKPRTQYIASQIQQQGVAKMFLGVGAFNVVDSGTGDYKDVRKCVAQVKASRIVGDVLCAAGPELGAEIRSSGLGLFQATALDKTFEDSTYGKIDRCEIVETPDVQLLTAGTHALGAGTTLRNKTLVNTDGATTITLEVNGGTATLTGTIAAGEMFTLAGVYGVDVYGNSTGKLFPFVAQALATAGSNELAVTVQPIYFTGASKNVSVANLAATTAAAFPLTASAVYKRAIIWTKPAFTFVNRMLPQVKGWDNQSITSLKGISFLATEGGDFLTGVNTVAWRVLSGFATCYNSGLCGYYVKVS